MIISILDAIKDLDNAIREMKQINVGKAIEHIEHAKNIIDNQKIRNVCYHEE